MASVPRVIRRTVIGVRDERNIVDEVAVSLVAEFFIPICSFLLFGRQSDSKVRL